MGLIFENVLVGFTLLGLTALIAAGFSTLSSVPGFKRAAALALTTAHPQYPS